MAGVLWGSGFLMDFFTHTQDLGTAIPLLVHPTPCGFQ